MKMERGGNCLELQGVSAGNTSATKLQSMRTGYAMIVIGEITL